MPNRLQEFRLAHKETQREIADLLGLKTAAAYCKKEIGATPVTLDQAYALAIHWGTTIETLFYTRKGSFSATGSDI